MKKLRTLLLLATIALSCLFIRCDCCINCPSGDIDIELRAPEDEATIYTPTVDLEFKVEFINAIKGETAQLHIHEIGTSMWRTRDLEPGDTTFEFSPLKPATIYGWYIEASALIWHNHRRATWNSWSPERTFTTADTLWAFGRLQNPTPDSGAIDVDTIPTFYWEVYNPYDIDFEFEFYFGTSPDPPLVATGLDTNVYSHDTLLPNTIYYWKVVAYNDTDRVEGPVWNFTTIFGGVDEIFALLEIDALQAPSGYHTGEWLRVRLDAGYAPLAPDDPLQADSVYVGGIRLPWDAPTSSYYLYEQSMPFITNGSDVDFIVFGNAAVPHLNTSFSFPACTLSILTPESFDNVPISGFEVTWSHSDCDGGTVWLVLMDGSDSTGVRKLVPNDGLDSLKGDDLVPLGGVTGPYDLYIIRQVEESITATGYIPLSFVRFRAMNRMIQINITGS